MADKKKWIGAAGLVFFTILLLLAGIRYEKGSKKNHTEIENTEKGEPAESKEMDHIIMTYQTLSISRLDHLDAVMEEVNRIEAGTIPDVAEDSAVYLLYRAGVLRGDEDGSFYPDTQIRRCEVAAIVTRMVVPALRVRFAL